MTLPRATREARLQALAATYARWLEDLVARSPYDWFNFYDFWADDPISIGRRDMQQPAQERDAKNPES